MAESSRTPPRDTIVARTRATIDRIEGINETLNAFVSLSRETALSEAALTDVRTARGDKPGLLHGLPIAVKDIVDVAGVVSGCGSLTREQAPPADCDAFVVQKLRAAGAIIPGKTHTVEYALGGYGTNITVGTPKNPWDRAIHRIPGGSSSGSGVAVGAGLVPGAIGTDTGGSVRIPAALCGCVGLKTSLGCVSRSGVAPLSQTLDSVGPLAKDVTTAAAMFLAMQGSDPADTSTDGIKPLNPFPDLERGVKGLRLGRIGDDDLPLASQETKADFAAATEILQELGAQIHSVKLPETFEQYGVRCGRIIAAEGYANWRSLVDDPNTRLAPPVHSRMLAGKSISAADYLGDLNLRREAINAALSHFDRLDAIILPTTPFPAIPVADVDETRTPMAAHTRWVNYLNLAAIAIPTTVGKEGLPLSLQIVVRRFDDSLALRIARAFELARGPYPRPPV